MKLDEKKLYQMMSEFHTLGDEEYGGQGTFQEAVLVGYVYGVLSENRYSELKYDELDRKVYSFGGFNYVVWFEEIIAGEDDSENPLGELEIRIESAPAEDESRGEDDDPILIPVAIEGPYSDEDIRTFIEGGDL